MPSHLHTNTIRVDRRGGEEGNERRASYPEIDDPAYIGALRGGERNSSAFRAHFEGCSIPTRAGIETSLIVRGETAAAELIGSAREHLIHVRAENPAESLLPLPPLLASLQRPRVYHPPFAAPINYPG